ncbi:MAG: TonB-dependent receptor [Cytophagales bacterium]|nr:TonB-dependent receptor [Cytophagales bacterium]
MSFKILISSLIIAYCLLPAAYCFSQDQWGEEGEIKSSEIIIEKDRKIELPAAIRNYEKIGLHPVRVEKTPQKYVFEEFKLDLPPLSVKMKILKMRRESITKPSANYIKAGFGNYFTSYLDLFLNNEKSKKYTYGTYIGHLASQNGPVDNSGSSHNELSVYGKYFMRKFTVSGNLNYDRDVVYYYGYDQKLNPEIGKGTIKQRYSIISFSGNLRNRPSYFSKILFNADVGYYHLDALNDFREDDISFKATGKANLDIGKKYFDTSGYVNIDLAVNPVILPDTQRLFIFIDPSYTFLKRAWQLKLGLSINFENELLFLRPDLYMAQEILGKKLIYYTGWYGYIQPNKYRDLISENPFVNDSLVLKGTLHDSKFTGVKGNVLRNLNYDLHVSFDNIQDMPLFINATIDTSKFDVIYDDIDLFTFHAALSYQFSERVKILLNGDYFSYNMDAEKDIFIKDKPWHLPDFRVSLMATYNLKNKIFFNSDIYYISGLFAKIPGSGEVKKLESILDLNLKVDYRFSDKFSTFVEVNNILSKSYQRYLYYPSKGINVIGGAAYSF